MADDNTKLIIVLEAQSRKLQNSLVQVNRQIDRFAAQTERRFDQMNKRNAASFDALGRSMKNSVGGLQGIIAPLIGTLGVREVIRYADAWQEAQNKISAAAQVSGLQARSLEELKTSANGARQELAGYVDLYARLLRVSPGIAATELEVAAATDTVAKSLKAGGASAQEQGAALIQLGQALGSGFLQGDELRSIRENAPLLAQAIAKEFGVTIGKLKDLGAEGKITSDRVFKAILNGGADIEAAFQATQSTIADAFTRIENEFTQFVANTGSATGATQGLIDALNYLAANFQTIAPVVANFAAILAGAFAGRFIAVPIVQATIALGGFLAAMATGTLTAVTFSAALGPIALIAGAAAAAIVLLNNAQGDAARAAEAHAQALVENQNKLDLARGASDEFRKALQQQIALQLKAAEAALTEADAQLEAAQTKAMAAGVFDIAMQALGGALGMTDGKLKPSQYTDGIIDPAQANVDASRARIADLRRQMAEIDSIRLTPEGNGDRAGGGMATGASGTKPKGDTQWQNALDGINKRTAALMAQSAAQAAVNPLVDDYGFAMEKAKAASDLLQAAQDANIAITPELKVQIEALSIGYAAASVEAKKLAESQDQIRASAEYARDTMKDVTRTWISDLMEGKSAAEAFSNALSNIGDRLIGLGLDTLFGGGQTKGFGAVGKLFGFAKGGVASNGKPRMFANGGVSGTAAVFGEAGPEAAVPLPDGRRIPVDLRMPASSGQGGTSVSIPISIDATGADSAAIQRLEAGLSRMKAELPSRVVAAVRDAKNSRSMRG